MEPDDRVIVRVESDPRRKGVYRIVLNDGHSFAVHEDVLVRFRLVKGATVSEQAEREALEEDGRQRAYRDAVLYLGRAMRSAGEVRARLQAKGHAPDVIDRVMERLEEQGLVDDAAYAEALAGQRLRLGGKGRQWIRRELLGKGIGKAETERALASIDPRDEWEQAWRLASRRWPSIRGEPPVRLRKAMNLLLRRGFPADVARSVVMKLKNGLPEEERAGGYTPDGGRKKE